MQCINQISEFAFELPTTQPAEYTTCTYLLVQPTELENQVFNLTSSQGLEISGAIALVWAVAFGFRMAIKSTQSEKEIES